MSAEVIKLSFPFALLLAVCFIAFVYRTYLFVHLSILQIILILLTIPSIVFLAVTGLLTQDAFIGIIGSIIGFGLGSFKPLSYEQGTKLNERSSKERSS